MKTINLLKYKSKLCTRRLKQLQQKCINLYDTINEKKEVNELINISYMALNNEILTLFKNNPKGLFNVEEIAQQITYHQPHEIANELNRMANNQQLKMVHNSLFMLNKNYQPKPAIYNNLNF